MNLLKPKTVQQALSAFHKVISDLDNIVVSQQIEAEKQQNIMKEAEQKLKTAINETEMAKALSVKIKEFIS